MKTRLTFFLFLALAGVHLSVPALQIYFHEDTLVSGAVYKFRTAPVDPYDPFRGRYVALNYADTHAPLVGSVVPAPNSSAYALLRADVAGYVQFVGVSATPPDSGDYLRVEAGYSDIREGVQFRLPFDRYYMPEHLAPSAEEAYRRHVTRAGRHPDDTYVQVRVKAGRGVIEDLYVRNQPVAQFLAAEAASP